MIDVFFCRDFFRFMLARLPLVDAKVVLKSSVKLVVCCCDVPSPFFFAFKL